MMEWILTICTTGWLLCSHHKEVEYPSRDECYVALEMLREQAGDDAFKYIYCSPKQPAAHGSANQ